jgi:hypothetical protein
MVKGALGDAKHALLCGAGINCASSSTTSGLFLALGEVGGTKSNSASHGQTIKLLDGCMKMVVQDRINNNIGK